MQLILLSSDLRVLSILPGFWHPQDLARELRLGLQLNRLWRDQRSRPDKERMFRRMITRDLKRQPAATYARSAWQGFDGHREAQRHRVTARDSFFTTGGKLRQKPLNLLFKERLAAQPFRPLARFDMEAFTDFGKRYYDLNRRHDKGRKFAGAAARAERARERENRKLRVAAKKQRIAAKRQRRKQSSRPAPRPVLTPRSSSEL